MFGLAILVLAGYFAAASLRSLSTLSDKIDEDTWVKNHPYHIFLKHEVDQHRSSDITVIGFIGMLMAIISLAIIPLILGHEGSSAYWLAYGAGIFGYLGVALNYWLIRGTIRKIKKAAAEINNWRQRTKNKWQSRIPSELVEAKKYQKDLKKIINGKRRQKQLKPILKKIDKLVKEELPRLLKLRTQLGVQVKDAQTTINRQKANGICEGEEELMTESEKGLEILQQRLENVKKRIIYILTSLDHMSVRFDLIMSAESTGQSQKEISEVLEDLDIMLKAKQDVDGLFHELALNGVPELDPHLENEIPEEENLINA